MIKIINDCMYVLTVYLCIANGKTNMSVCLISLLWLADISGWSSQLFGLRLRVVSESCL